VQYLRVVVDASRGRYGLSVEDVQDALRVQIEGQRAGTVIDGNRRIPIVLRADGVKVSPAEFAALHITTPTDRACRCRSWRAGTRRGPVKIDREMGSRYSVVIANVTGATWSASSRKPRPRSASGAAAHRLPHRLGRAVREPAARGRALTLVVPLSLGVIFLVLFSTFGSVRQALLVLSNVPFALVGGIMALWLTGEYLSVPPRWASSPCWASPCSTAWCW
jgi:cobalt-zinc-cadmium resistance protein CzcA